MTISSLIVTSNSDRPETHLFVGLYKAGIDIEVLCPPSAPHRQILIDAGIPVYDLVLKKRFDRSGIAIIKQHLLRKSFDIIHAFNNNTVSNSLMAAKGHDIRFIAYRGIEGNVSYWDPFSWTTYLHPRVDKIVCVANAIRDYFHEMSIFGIKKPVSKALTIYKGHDKSWYQYNEVDLSNFGIPNDAFTVGCIVNDRPRKGLDQLILAAKLLPIDTPIHFVLIGNINKKELLEQIRQSPYKEKIHLLGFREDAPEIIKACDVCILPAIKREGLPKGIIEGMIQGVAPIVTNAGGSPELIEDGKSGLIIPPLSPQAIADAIKKLYSDTYLLQSIKENAQLRIETDFHVSATIKQHLVLYQKLIGKSI
ncbi:MAG: glycosyltransferase family 4 protein [Cellvibrionaceae bacterium]